MNMVQNAKDKLPSLKRIGILVVGRKIAERQYMHELEWPVTDDECLYTKLREACKEAAIELDIRNARKGVATDVPYFQEQTAVRNWGRDW